MIENPILILQYYADPRFLNSALHLGTIFPEWGEISYWHASGTDFCKGQKVWMFMSRESDSIYHGSYIVHEFEIGKDNETFIPCKLFILLFGIKKTMSTILSFRFQILFQKKTTLTVSAMDSIDISNQVKKYKFILIQKMIISINFPIN